MMNVLVVDIGGTNVKLWKTGEADKLKFPSGKLLDPGQLVKQVKKLTTDWTFERVSIGYPGQVANGRDRWPILITSDPVG